MSDAAASRDSPEAGAPRSAAADDAFIARFVGHLRALAGGGSAPLALHEPDLTGAERALVAECIDSGWVSTAGAFVPRFEAALAERCGVAHAVAVVNGTAALHVALLAAGIGAGDEVIVPALTFVATANAVSHAGAVPHFADCDPGTPGMDPAALRAHLEAVAVRRGGACINMQTGLRIAAIIPVHVFGHPADMDALCAVAADYGLPVIEDAAEALGSLYRGRPCGGLGRMGVLSFNGNKIVTTGGGGAVLTDDPDLARRVRHLATTAKAPHRWAFRHDAVGCNYRLPNLNAALGCAQLARLDDFLADKRLLAERYIEGFAAFEGLTVLREPAYAESNYWLNTVLLDADRAHLRERLLDAAHAAGLMCRPVWTPLHHLPMYRDCPRAPLPVTDAIWGRLMNIPSSARLGAREA